MTEFQKYWDFEVAHNSELTESHKEIAKRSWNECANKAFLVVYSEDTSQGLIDDICNLIDYTE